MMIEDGSCTNPDCECPNCKCDPDCACKPGEPCACNDCREK